MKNNMSNSKDSEEVQGQPSITDNKYNVLNVALIFITIYFYLLHSEIDQEDEFRRLCNKILLTFTVLSLVFFNYSNIKQNIFYFIYNLLGLKSSESSNSVPDEKFVEEIVE